VPIEDIHWSILRRFVWQADQETFGRFEHWDRPVEREGLLYGDCDDYAIACYYALIDEGYEPELAVCYVPGIGGHAVCLVDGWVLDNRFRRPYLLTENPGGYVGWSRSDGSWRKPWMKFELQEFQQ
jgi:predicted transglutaminase-like cysteine proteinase